MSESSPQGRLRSVLMKLVRWVWEARDRRTLRYLQRRAEWIEEARNAPTVQSRIDEVVR